MQYFSLVTAVTRQIARENNKTLLLYSPYLAFNKGYSNYPAISIGIEEKEFLCKKNIEIVEKFTYQHFFNENDDKEKRFSQSYTLQINPNKIYQLKEIDEKSDRRAGEKNSDKSSGKPPLEKILFVKDELTKHLPKFLKETHPYRLYTANVIFENFYQEPGRTYIGATQYAIQLTIIRFRLNWKFSHAKVDILKITHDENEGTIKIRWRVSGVGGFKSMVQMWKIDVTNIKDSIKRESEWIDGFSILYLNQQGYIYKHTLQRVMTQYDEDSKLGNKKIKNIAMAPTMCSNQNYKFQIFC